MTDAGPDDLSGGDVAQSEKSDIRGLLEREVWRYRWEQRLTYITLGLIAVFYISLLVFLFVGQFRLTIGNDYWFFATKSHLATDIPIIVALSTIPTLLLIALLKYFHYRERKGDDEDASLPIGVQALREIVKSAGSSGR